MGVIVRRDDGHETSVKGNDCDGWSSDGMVLWLVRRQNRDPIEWWRGWPRLRWFFYSSGGGSRAVRGGWSAAVVQIQCFSFDSRGETTWQRVIERWNRGSELILSPWEGSVTRRSSVATSAGGEAVPRKEKGGDDTYCADVNLTGSKN
jgi:hypothetical protein